MGRALRRAAVALAGCLAIAFASTCSSGTTLSRDQATSATAERVRISTVPGTVLALPQYVAQERGFFTQNGLDVEVVPTASGPAAIQALLAGDVDIMLNAPDFVLQANDKGQSIKYVIGNIPRSLLTLVARTTWPTPNKGAYPQAVRDLEGAKIGVTARGSVTEHQLRVMMTDAGLNPDDDVTIVAAGQLDTAIAALDKGLLDAWMGFEPGTTIVTAQLQVATVLVDLRKGDGPSRLTDYQANGYAAFTSYIERNDRVIQGFVSAIEEAHQWLADPANRAELEAIVARNVTIDKALIPRLIDDNIHTFGAAIPERNIGNAIELMMDLRLIEERPEYTDVVATQYVPTR